MKKILFVLTVAIFCLSTPLLAADAKIGYVDLQKALNNSAAGKAAKEKIAAKVKGYEGQIDQKQKELKKLKDDLDKQGLLLSDETRGGKERDYQQKLKDLQRFTKDIQDELQQKDNEFTKQILMDLSKIISELGAKEGYTVILEKTESAVLFAEPSADLTDKVIKAYDAAPKK